MKKIFALVAILAGGLMFFSSCNKGDDNPYADWKCTCFVTHLTYVIDPPDTVIVPVFDTVYLQANDMDKVTALSFCQQAQMGYTDTIGGSAACKLK